MQLVKLSQRLMTLAQMVPPGARVADIGTDHALLPCYLLLEQRSPAVIGVEVNQGPYQKACVNVRAAKLEDRIELRLGNGLAVINPAEVEVVIIAGMGGSTIKEILDKAPEITATLKKLILQPMTGAEVVRVWLAQQGWVLTEEELLYEDKQYYQILGAEKHLLKGRITASADTGAVLGDHARNGTIAPPMPPILKELADYYGPLLLKNRHPLLPALLTKDLAGLQDILSELAKSNKDEAKQRYQEYLRKVEKLKELKEWLLAAKR